MHYGERERLSASPACHVPARLPEKRQARNAFGGSSMEQHGVAAPRLRLLSPL